MSVTLRPVDVGDEMRWRELFKAYGDFYSVDIAEATYTAVWNWIFDPAEDFWCTLAVDADGAFGFTQYQLMHRSLSGGKVVYLSDLYVDPAKRVKGVGRQLIDSVFVFARERGITNVRWLTQENNYTARGLYDTYQHKSDFLLYSVNT